LKHLFCFGEDLCNVGLFHGEIEDEQECHQCQQCVQDDDKNAFGDHIVEQIGEGKQGSNGGDGETTVDFIAPFFGLLALGFHYIEEPKTNDGAQAECGDDHGAQEPVHAHEVAQHCGEHTEAHAVTQRVDLNAECLFVVGAVLFASGNGAVKGIAEAAEKQAQHSGGKAASTC